MKERKWCTNYVNRKEIKNLIGIIKKEKEQVTNKMSVLTKELKKYKAAYKRLVREIFMG